jgi:hypothetical protein
MTKRIGFLQDDLGDNSLMRLMSLTALISAIAFGWYSITHETSSGTEITLAFLGFAFAGKATQKVIEKKVNNHDL